MDTRIPVRVPWGQDVPGSKLTAVQKAPACEADASGWTRSGHEPSRSRRTEGHGADRDHQQSLIRASRQIWGNWADATGQLEGLVPARA